MRVLDHVPTTGLLVSCEGCRRSGSYRVDRLVAVRGARFPLAAFLVEIRTRCVRADCKAVLRVPLALDLDRGPGDANLFTIDTWTGESARDGIEMQVGAVHNFDVATATFAAAVARRPHSCITLRNRTHVYRAHRPDTAEMQARGAALLKRLGLR